MRVVVVESPYAGTVYENVTYARECLADCLSRGEAPFASHLLYTQDGVLDDHDPFQRDLGISAGLAIAERADATVVYVDHGITPGMRAGIRAALRAGRVVEYRGLGHA
ncbi:hypothetical protein F8O07_06565 [Pseudoclavibacter sp. CFCC 13796]|uniref:DUF7768 domain-containing protein n=1 Tax=unclassified Pseudoclavibacter TaxID=2615177 RepID=UPI001300E919|nr:MULTISPECIES: hypothetical protein [unclassified Pseudoclavibacter]KAB1661562.1 hypothetical protein F8O07_06565 [Pseudoclavibacter sp. CFCC 13796]MCD7100555.1 hypothetical protein [Pseudoclavibacter sp. 13-3]